MGQLGLEDHPQKYITKLVTVCDELKRVLKSTGTFWLNLGDSYYASGGAGGDYNIGGLKEGQPKWKANSKTRNNWLQPKQRLMMPERIAIALQDKGWILRNHIVWDKPNHMPSSVKDRLSNGWESIFLLVKSKRYFFDLDAIRIAHRGISTERLLAGPTQDLRNRNSPKHKDSSMGQVPSSWNRKGLTHKGYWDCEGKPIVNLLGANPCDVWEMSTASYAEAHFATFPEELPERCIKAGCPKEVCDKCGKPRFFIDITQAPEGGYVYERNIGGRKDGYSTRLGKTDQIRAVRIGKKEIKCDCNASFSPGIVLDPFAGSGTTLRVAQQLGRRWLGIELNPKYVKMAYRRIYNKSIPLFHII